MFSKYFRDFSKQITKKPSSKKSTTSKKSVPTKVDIKKIKESFSGIIPSSLKIENAKIIDKSGFAPEGIDLVVYKEYCQDMLSILGGYVPYELAQAAIFVVPTLDKKSLIEVLTKVVAAKKLNRFALESKEKEDAEGELASEETEQMPVFILVLNSKYELLELKNDIVNWYLAKGIDLSYEFDLMSIVNSGVVVKNWREKTYLAIESMEDTSMWFFILMNEYLENETIKQFDFRDYIKKSVVYNQY